MVRKPSLNLRKRQFEELECRRVLANEIMADLDWIGQQHPSSLCCIDNHSGMNPIADVRRSAPASVSRSGPLSVGEGEAGVLESPFVTGLRRTVTEIGRLLQSVSDTELLRSPIPLLGSRLSTVPGQAPSIDTVSIGSLFELASRFTTEISGPLEQYLNENPQATPAQLTSQFSFLQSLESLDPGVQGVRIVFDRATPALSPLISLLEPITQGGILAPNLGTALSEDLSFQIQSTNLHFDLIEDLQSSTEGMTRFGLKLPDIRLQLTRDTVFANQDPISFSANLGIVQGTVVGGGVLMDTTVGIDLSNIHHLVDDASDVLTGAFAGAIRLDRLSSLSTASIREALQPRLSGIGLQVDFPFELQVGGFSTAVALPRFQLSDINPLDTYIPKLELVVPENDEYTAENLIGFATIDTTTLLSYFEQIGEVIGAWQSGSLLKAPFPLVGDLTVGEAAGLVDAYAASSLQFLRDPTSNLPRFASIQELASLIPSVDVYGPQQQVIRYDAQSQQFLVSLE
nr:hypothetical protein [Pirellula sp.]